MIKTKKQIKGIRKSCQLAAKALRFIADKVGEGASTFQLNKEIDQFIRDRGGMPASFGYLNYPAATCISVNDVVCHGVPSDYRLKNGDILNIDIATIYDGYYGDTGAMFTVGQIAPDAQHLLEVSRECLNIGIQQVRPNNYFGNIGYEVNRYAVSRGCSTVVDFSGHGMGVKFHEEPAIPFNAPQNSGERMQVGNIFTIEPMINLGKPEVMICEQDHWTVRTKDGTLSAQYEHSVLVTDTGYEILTEIKEC